MPRSTDPFVVQFASRTKRQVGLRLMKFTAHINYLWSIGLLSKVVTLWPHHWNTNEPFAVRVWKRMTSPAPWHVGSWHSLTQDASWHYHSMACFRALAVSCTLPTGLLAYLPISTIYADVALHEIHVTGISRSKIKTEHPSFKYHSCALAYFKSIYI